MKALTINQPWAGSILRLGKNVENRSWSTPHRGMILIHAGRSIWGTNKPAKNLSDDTAWATGAIVGVADLVDCVKGVRSQWSMPGQWHWVLEDPQVLPEPVQVKGSLGLWSVDAALAKRIAELL